MAQHWWVDEVEVNGKNVRAVRYRRVFGEHDHLVDLSSDVIMTVGLNGCLFNSSGSRQRRLADCIKSNNFSMDLANISFSEGLCPIELFRTKTYH